MPNIHEIREKRDKSFYDTADIGPGQAMSLFANKTLEDIFKTNMERDGFVPGTSYLVWGIGIRLIGKTREQEDLLLDHIRLVFKINDRHMYDMVGPQASILRHAFTSEELKRIEDRQDTHSDTRRSENSFADRIIKGLLSPLLFLRAFFRWSLGIPGHIKVYPDPMSRVGYHFSVPFMIPEKMGFEVNVVASKDLPENVTVRVHLFGHQTLRVP